MAQFWEQDEVVAPVPPTAGTPTMRQIVAPQPDHPPAQTQTQAEIDAERLENLREPPPTLPAGYRLKPDGTAERIPGLPVTDTGEGKPLPAWAAKPFEDQVGIYAALASATDNYKPEFAGNTVTGDLENKAQGLLGVVGTPGQRDWWAQFRATDTVIRNKMFGATLTPSEQAAYDATTIHPGMDPEQVRLNLKSRREIVRKALGRKVGFLSAQGYNKDAISALAGEYAGDFSPQQIDQAGQDEPPPGDTPPPGGPGAEPDPRGNPLTPEQQSAYDAFLKANPNASPDELVQFTRMIGKQIDPDRAVEVMEHYRKYGTFAPGAEAEPLPVDISDARSGDEVVDPIARGVADTVTLGFADEIAAGVNTIAGDGSYSENLARERAIDDYDQENNFWLRAGGQLAGGAALPLFAARTPAQLAKVGAAYGGAYGAGSSESLAEVPGSVVTGAAAGGAAGWGGGKLLEKLAGRTAARAAQPAKETAADRYARAQQFGLDVSVGDVRGMGSKVMERGLDVSPGSAGAMNDARQGLQTQLEGAVDDVARTYGPTTSHRGMGAAAQRGAQKWISRFEEVAHKAYDAIPISPKAQAALTNTRTALAELTTIFESNPKLAETFKNTKLNTYLEALGSDGSRPMTERAEKTLRSQWEYHAEKGSKSAPIWGVVDPNGVIVGWTVKKSASAKQAENIGGSVEPLTPDIFEQASGGGLSWPDLKALRSRIGEEIGEQRFSDSPTKGELRRLYAALSEDMKLTAAAQGPEALRKFERANNLYREGQDRIDNALVKILGDDAFKNPEAAASRLQTIAREGKSGSDLRLVQEVWKSLPTEERAEVANGLLRLAGRPANSEGRDFSPETFMRTWTDMAPEAKNLIFGPVDKELRSNLDEFARVMKDLAANRSTRNTSNTGMAVTGALMFGIGSWPGLLAQVATSYGVAKLWTNPKFVQRITGYAKMVRGAAKAGQAPSAAGNATHARLLEKLAASEPAIAQEALGIRQLLLTGANDNFGTSVAASETEEK